VGICQLLGALQDSGQYRAPDRGANPDGHENDAIQEFIQSDPQLSDSLANALPIDMMEPVDVSNAIVWLVSDDARYVTRITLPGDAGLTNKK
jgi:NAD(P)-dependent dehydrogenase (short-subunit alcohol dehydrogenase family)